MLRIYKSYTRLRLRGKLLLSQTTDVPNYFLHFLANMPWGPFLGLEQQQMALQFDNIDNVIAQTNKTKSSIDARRRFIDSTEWFRYGNIYCNVKKSIYYDKNDYHFKDLNDDQLLFWLPVDRNWSRKYEKMRSLPRAMLWLLSSFKLFHMRSFDLNVSSLTLLANMQDEHQTSIFYKPIHKIFLMHISGTEGKEVGWGLFIGITDKILQEEASRRAARILVPKGTTITDMCGEVCERAKPDDHYHVELGESSVVCTCWQGPDKPLVGGAGFFVNHSCSDNRLLSQISQTDFSPGKVQNIPIDNRPVPPLDSYYVVTELQTSMDLYWQHFVGDNDLFKMQVEYEDQLWHCLPLETNYGVKRAKGTGFECRCLTHCWNKKQGTLVNLPF